MMIAGLERATSGSVRVAGHDFMRTRARTQLALVRGSNIGIVFQSFHLVPTMTALENVALPLEFAGKADAFDDCPRAAGRGRPRASRRSFPGAALGRRAAACRHRPRAEPAPADHPRRRADRQSRRQDRRAGDRPAVRPAAAAAGDPRPRHPRSEAGRALRSHRAHGRRPRSPARSSPPHDGRGRPNVGAGGRPFGGCRWSLSLALREQRNGLSGFYVFIACVALGVAVITGVGALADALRAELRAPGRGAARRRRDAGRARTGRPRARSATGCGSRVASARRRPCAPWRGGRTAASRRWSS